MIAAVVEGRGHSLRWLNTRGVDVDARRLEVLLCRRPRRRVPTADCVAAAMQSSDVSSGTNRRSQVAAASAPTRLWAHSRTRIRHSVLKHRARIRSDPICIRVTISGLLRVRGGRSGEVLHWPESARRHQGRLPSPARQFAGASQLERVGSARGVCHPPGGRAPPFVPAAADAEC